MKLRLLLFFLLLVPFCAKAQDDSTQIDRLYKPNLEELNSLERVQKGETTVSVAGFTAATVRESAGIVTLITSEEILKMGARDVVDILRTVPGFDVAFDINPILTVRGNSANEGKLLFLIDGQAINDISLGYSMVFQRFAVLNIDRIEIIRGAGSVIYGGQAGLAVINIITKKISNNNELSFSTTLGITGNAWNRSIVEGYALTKLKNGTQIDISGSYNYGKQTDRNYLGGLQGATVDNAKYSWLNAHNFNIGLRYKNLQIRFVQNKYFSNNPHFGDAKINIAGTFFTAGYMFNLSPKVSLYTKLSFKQQTPYYFSDIPDSPISSGIIGKLESVEAGNITESRILTNTSIVYKPIEMLTFSAGIEAFYDKSSYFATNYRFNDGSQAAEFSNIGAFAEVSVRSKIANVTAGARVDKYGNVEPVVVPRLAITRAFNRLHFKALYSRAFKAPTILNIKFAKLGTPILPEKFQLIEFEVGFRIDKKLRLSTNVYDIQIQNFITRQDLNTTQFEFTNAGNVRTQGIEGELCLQKTWGEVNLGYSFYRVFEANKDRLIEGLPSVMPGLPAQKATLRVSVNITKDFSVNMLLIHLTNKFRKSFIESNAVYEFPSEQHLNLNLQYKNFLLKNLSVTLGCYNVLDQVQYLLSSKRDGSSDVFLPTQSREFLLKLIYNIKN